MFLYKKNKGVTVKYYYNARRIKNVRKEFKKNSKDYLLWEEISHVRDVGNILVIQREARESF